MTKRTYQVHSPIKFGDDRYHPNDKKTCVIDLTESEAEPLLAVNAISVSSETKKEVSSNNNSNIVQLKKAPEDKADRIVAIKEAIELLDKEDETHWTKNEMPDANVLTELLGWKVKAAERNEAWMETLKAEGEK